MKKKIIALLMGTILLATLMAGCSKKMECDFCYKEKKCITIDVLGEEAHICEDCSRELEEMFK